MNYLLDIVSSDGESISAVDEADPVTAALEEWGFLSTLVADLSLESEEAVDAFVEQLNSSEAAVQIAAGENIALLYEKCHKPRGSDEDDNDPEHENGYDEAEAGSDPEDMPSEPKLVQAYVPYHNPTQLIHILSELASINTRRISRKEQKEIRTHFAEILNSIEHPTRGPRYSNAVSPGTGMRYGSRMVVRIHRDGMMRIDKWWKLHRLQALRRLLQGGFVTHYEKNDVIFDSLP